MTLGTDTSHDERERYIQTLDQSGDALYLVDADGYFDVVNRAFLDLTGYERDSLIGASIEMILHENDVNESQRRLGILQTDTETDSEMWLARFVTKRGTEIPVELEYVLLHTAEGEYAGFAGRARNIREKAQLEEKLDILNRVLRHNIRNQMNIILSHAATIQTMGDSSCRTAAETIETVGQEIVTLSEKARKAHEHLDIPPDEDCQVELVEATRLVRQKFAISYPNAAVDMDLPDRVVAFALPSYGVALVELMENAVVHHPSGNGPVTVEVKPGDETVTVHVKDECEPVPAETVETITRGEEQPLRHNDGLGLWLVRWMVDAVGGTLTFDRREDDTGNTVTLTFDRIE